MARAVQSLFVVALVATAAAPARATEVEVVAVMWQQDLSVKSKVEQFFGCLVDSSTFGTTWAQEFSLTKVTFKGVYVLADACPTDAHLGGNLRTILENAFAAGTLPKPSAGGTSYLLYLPAGVQGYDDSEIPACQGTYCGVHAQRSWQGVTYDAALVPINCADCGSVQVTLIGEHEAAEAIANFGSAQYEVGDDCQGSSHETQLACCGTQYPIQQLASNRSSSDCQTISATGNMCGPTPPDMAMAPPPDMAAPLDMAMAPAADLATTTAPPDMAAPSPDGGSGNGGGGGGNSGGGGSAGGTGGNGDTGGAGGSAGAGGKHAGCAFGGGGAGTTPMSLVVALLLSLALRRRRSFR